MDCIKSVVAAARRRHAWRGTLVVYLAFLALLQTSLWPPDTLFTGEDNAQIAEADSWLEGRLDLPERLWDTAEVNGRYYSHFPPMFTIISAGVVWLFDGVPHWFVLMVLVAPIPGLAYALFFRRTGSWKWGAVLAIGLVCGTSLWCVLDKTLRGAAPYHTNHALATLGLLVFLLEYFGHRRVWVAGVGLIIAALSRQLTVFFVIPLVAMALSGEDGARRRARLVAVGAVVVILAAVPMVLSTLKFTSPLDTGYMRIYEGRDDDLAMAAKEHGLFSAHFVPRNLYYANLGLPRVQTVQIMGEERTYVRPNLLSTGIWWTTPLLVWVIVGFRRIAGDSRDRWLLAASVGVYIALLFFHGTGEEQRGFNRFSLDYVPVMLAMAAPLCIEGRRRWVSLLMVVWSVTYFRFLLAVPHIGL